MPAKHDIFRTPTEGVRKISGVVTMELKYQLLLLVIGLFSPFLTCYFKNLICVFARYVTAFVFLPLGVSVFLIVCM